MAILEELYNGNIVPSEKFIKKGGEYQKVNDELSEKIEKLTCTLNSKEKDLCEEIGDGICKLSYISEKECFIEGFRLGAQIMREILEYKSENFI